MRRGEVDFDDVVVVPVPTFHEYLLWVTEEQADDPEVCDDVCAGNVQLFEVWATVAHLGKEDVVGNISFEGQVGQVLAGTAKEEYLKL